MQLLTAPELTERDWPPGRRPLDLPVVELRAVTPPATIATKLCPAEHPNNPDTANCVVCLQAIATTAPVVDMTPRPVARLLLEDGTGIDVADRLTIGRSPVATSEARRDETDTLTVDGRQVSRRHMTLEVKGWQLLIRDADSTNGTFLARRGERGRRRVPIERAIPVRIGDAIHFGSRQALVVHAR